MEFVDRALARRLEAAEEMPQVHYARLYQKLRPEVNAAVEPVCGGHMIFAGVGARWLAVPLAWDSMAQC